MTRTFSIPRASLPPISLELHEPSLTGDDLGLKTWAASYLLSKRLPVLASRLPCLGHDLPKPRILELGSGTGLVGLAFAAMFPSTIHLTDLAEIVPNLAANVSANSRLVEDAQSTVKAFELDWAAVGGEREEEDRYDVILSADPIYSQEHPRLLAGAIRAYLHSGEQARVLIELPLRDAYSSEREELWSRLRKSGLKTLDEGEEIGFDDWDDGKAEVKCHWSIWAR